MHRIDHATKETDTFGTGKHGFTEGTPPSVPATIVTDDAANAWQEELCNAVEYQFGGLVKGDRYQLNDVLQHMASDYLHSRQATTEGDFHPRMDLGYTTRVDQIAGLRGELTEGPVWLQRSGRVLRVMITDEKAAAFGFDDYTYTASKDTYLAVKIADGWSLEANAVALGAGAPSPTAGYVNFLKVITDGTDVTSSEALSSAWPEIYVQGLRIMDSDPDVFATSGLEGLRVYGGGSTFFRNELIYFQFMEGTTDRALPLVLGNINSTDGARIITRGQLTHRPHNESAATLALDYRKLRTHTGTSEEQGQAYTEHTLVGDQVGNGQTYLPLGEPATGEARIYRWEAIAVDSADASNTYARAGYFTAHNDGGTVGISGGVLVHDDDQSGGGVDINSYISGGVISLRVNVDDTKTYRVTAYVSYLETSITA